VADNKGRSWQCTVFTFKFLKNYYLLCKLLPSVSHVCKSQVIFLLTKGGVKQDDIGKVIALDPQLLGCSIAHKLEVSVKYFRSLGIYHFVLGQMIADFPTLLRYNVDILRPKYQYLRRVMVRPLKDLIEFPR
jgi:mTERF domain-containing protein, mitochondrial